MDSIEMMARIVRLIPELQRLQRNGVLSITSLPPRPRVFLEETAYLELFPLSGPPVEGRYETIVGGVKFTAIQD